MITYIKKYFSTTRSRTFRVSYKRPVNSIQSKVLIQNMCLWKQCLNSYNGNTAMNYFWFITEMWTGHKRPSSERVLQKTSILLEKGRSHLRSRVRVQRENNTLSSSSATNRQNFFPNMDKVDCNWTIACLCGILVYLVPCWHSVAVHCKSEHLWHSYIGTMVFFSCFIVISVSMFHNMG